jgi:hypothetical protein
VIKVMVVLEAMVMTVSSEREWKEVMLQSEGR